VLEPETRAKLEAAYLAQPDHPYAVGVSDAINVLDAVRASEVAG